MKKLYPFLLTIATSFYLSPSSVQAQVIWDTDLNKFRISGYLRSGVGASKSGDTQAHFQIPGALNKFSLGNQADTYGELQFDYTQYLNKSKNKSIELIWMVSYYEDFGTEDRMSFNKSEQLYGKLNNLFNLDETIWIGKRFYDRYAIHILDRQWLNPGHKGFGIGMENLLNTSHQGEDIKFGIWQFRDKDVTSPDFFELGDVYNYTADVRWVDHPISEVLDFNVALNYTYRARNRKLGYKGVSGFGVYSWIDYEKKYITNTTAVLFRQGATISKDHWTGESIIENPLNSNLILNNLCKSWSLEVNNNFLYDNLSTFAINAILLTKIRDYGTPPYLFDASASPLTRDPINPIYTDDISQYGTGRMLYWISLGVRPMYYISKQFRLTAEISQEFVSNSQLGVKGNLTKIAFSPEFALSKGFNSRPVLRPFINFARWNKDLRGFIGGVPNGAPYGDDTSGFTYGLQFEIWW